MSNKNNGKTNTLQEERTMRSKKRNILYGPLLLCLIVIVSCVTINIYFPAAAVEKAADEIVEETWGNNEKPTEEKMEEKPSSLIHRQMRFADLKIGVTVAHAQEADINVTTPAIRALKDSIKQRSDSIKPFMDRGNVGISNGGLLTIRSSEGLNLKDKANLTRLINAENKDRESLYSEIAKANNYGPERIPDIKKIFAKSWTKKARAGWWVQGEGGEWSQKQ
jgi:uncharacterized protein YdbL (DUF1318 family)